MGTRSLTIIRDEQGTDLLTMYRQFDGYPEGHGKALASFLAPFKVGNCITDYSPNVKQANGAGCLAAQVVAHFKRPTPKTKFSAARGPIGNFYVYPNGSKDVGEEYVYIVKVNHLPGVGYWINVDVLDGNWKQITEGSPAQIKAWIVKENRSRASRKAAQTRKAAKSQG